jgi:hypothetical protein
MNNRIKKTIGFYNHLKNIKKIAKIKTQIATYEAILDKLEDQIDYYEKLGLPEVVNCLALRYTNYNLKKLKLEVIESKLHYEILTFELEANTEED